MYYDRMLSDQFSNFLEPGGDLRWLFDFVKDREDLDFQIGKNKNCEWISVYRGLTRILRIKPRNSYTRILIDADKRYMDMEPSLFGDKSLYLNFQDHLISLISKIKSDSLFSSSYENKKEGFYQNMLSRRFGINGLQDDDWVIVDKEAVVGYDNEGEKSDKLRPIKDVYENILYDIVKADSKRYGSNLHWKTFGNELDFIALDRKGNILLIEYKHSKNTSGIYLSPLQIGMYQDIFKSFSAQKLNDAIIAMVKQKQQIGLINPSWPIPEQIKEIIPVLIISEYNYKSSAKTKFSEILQIVRKTKGQDFFDNLQTFNFTVDNGLSVW